MKDVWIVLLFFLILALSWGLIAGMKTVWPTPPEALRYER